MSALSDLVHIKDSERTALQNAVIAYDHRPQEAAAELAALNARVEELEKAARAVLGWHDEDLSDGVQRAYVIRELRKALAGAE